MRGGRVILRIEDLDASRVRAEATAGALVDLALAGSRLGRRARTSAVRRPLTSSRSDWRLYDAALDRLKASERDLSLHVHAGRHRARGQRPARRGRRTELSRAPARTDRAADADRLGDRPFAWRFRVPPGPSPGTTSSWADVEIDPCASRAATSSSRRHTVGPSYQLAVVVDDAAMGVNQVIRGSDLVPSTPRQILLYRALGWPGPASATSRWPSSDGRRLAKREAR